MTIDEINYELNEAQGKSEDPLAIVASLKVNGRDYLQKVLEPIAVPIEVSRQQFSSDLHLKSSAATQNVIYFDGQKWFDLASNVEDAFDTVISPRQRLSALTGLGSLSDAEANSLATYISAEGKPSIIALLYPDTPMDTEGMPVKAWGNDYHLNRFYIQKNLPVEGTPMIKSSDVFWDMLALGNNAAASNSDVFGIAVNEEELLSLWNRAHAKNLNPPTVPQIDFERESVFVVFLNSKQIENYSLEVTDVRLEDDEVYVDIRINDPAVTVITQNELSPWAMLRILKPDLAVVWVRSATSGNLIGAARR
ncbi:MAG: hypothetical protein R2880_13660 [Deinococcales bacterium]